MSEEKNENLIEHQKKKSVAAFRLPIKKSNSKQDKNTNDIKLEIENGNNSALFKPPSSIPIKNQERQGFSYRINIVNLIYKIILIADFLLSFHFSIQFLGKFKIFKSEIYFLLTIFLFLVSVSEFSPYYKESIIRNNFPFIVNNSQRGFLLILLSVLFFFNFGFLEMFVGLFMVLLGICNLVYE